MGNKLQLDLTAQKSNKSLHYNDDNSNKKEEMGKNVYTHTHSLSICYIYNIYSYIYVIYIKHIYSYI